MLSPSEFFSCRVPKSEGPVPLGPLKSGSVLLCFQFFKKLLLVIKVGVSCNIIVSVVDTNICKVAKIEKFYHTFLQPYLHIIDSFSSPELPEVEIKSFDVVMMDAK